MKKNLTKIPWWQPQLGKKEYSLLKKVLVSNFPNEGTVTTEFETKIAKLLNVTFALAVPSGTAAMYLSLKALGIGPGDEVIVPDMTFIATANAVEMTGAKAVLADIDKQTLTLDLKSFEENITKKTRAVIPVHVSGRAANMTAIIKLARKKNIFVVEDAAEAFMSKYKGKYLGTYGATGCFSFSPAKILTTGQGGMIVTNDAKMYQTLRMLKDQGRPTRGTGGDDIHKGIGFNFKFTDLQAAVGLGQLDYLDKRIIRLRKNNELYKRFLSGVKEVTLFESNTAEGELPLWTEILAKKRDELTKYLATFGIDCRNLWHPIHTQVYYKKSDAFFPNSTLLSPIAVWLPSAFTLKDSHIKKVCNLIRKYYKYDPIP